MVLVFVLEVRFDQKASILHISAQALQTCYQDLFL